MTLTDGKKHDVTAARQADLKLSPDSILVIDRGYVALDWLNQLDSQGVFFVTRLKKNMRYRLIGQHSCNESELILSDEIIEMDTEKSRKKYPGKLRLVTFYDEKNDKILKFLTNNFRFAASTIAQIYKLRWEIEKFFRWIKQNLKITAFFGTSKNAVLLQVWAAMIYYLLLHFIEFQTKIAWGIQELSRRIRATLLENRSLLDLLSDNFTSAKKPCSCAEQMTLF